jgi:hypothetical protein
VVRFEQTLVQSRRITNTATFEIGSVIWQILIKIHVFSSLRYTWRKELLPVLSGLLGSPKEILWECFRVLHNRRCILLLSSTQ